MIKNTVFKIALSFALLLILNTIQAVEVTFRVDMSEQTVAAEGVHIAGNFQGWDPAATEMLLTVDNIYAYTAEFTQGETIEYKFINGNAWGMDEQVPAGCAQNGNRFLTIPASNVELDAFCFGSCNICNPPMVEITFQVDMSNEDISPNGIHVAGSFQDPMWQPGDTEMLPIGGDVFAVTVLVGAGDYYEYKFINGNVWGDDETVPPDCSIGNNRYITVPEIPSILEAVCFGSCYPCGPTPIDINVSFQVDMSEQVISADGVHIGAGFQGWDPGATLMTDAGNNIYTYTTILSSGTYQEYKFVNGITWDDAENIPEECGQNNNRYLTLPWNDTIIDLVCFGSCGPCGPPPVDVNVTFQVDMSNEEVSPDGIHVAGSFQGWVADGTPMTLVAEDVYEVTLTMQSGFEHQYKFINGNSFDYSEIVPEECGTPDGVSGFNRYFTVPVIDTIMPALCFGSCEPCVPPLPDQAVTFTIDMSFEDVSVDGVHLAGSFQGWNPGETEMTLSTGNIYEVTLMLEQGSAHEFKYINGISFEDAEIVPANCAQNGNRFFTVPANDTTMTALCFGSCEPCGNPPVDVEITFRVDMANQTVSAKGVHIAGTFQGWQPGDTELTNVEDEIYAITVVLSSNSYQEYKFINGITWDDEEVVPEACANGGNRYYTVPEVNETLEALCFSSCDTCIIIGIENKEIETNAFDFYPNPANHSVYFYDAETVTIFTIDGKMLRKENIGNGLMDVSDISQGLYYIFIQNQSGSKYCKLIIK